MGLTTASNNFIWEIAKQSDETTIPTTAVWGMPVYSGRSRPVQSLQRVQVTDAASIIGDPYKSGDIHWEADVTVPAFAGPLPTLLKGLYGTDTKTGTDPYTHTMTGLGGATPWFTTYNTDLLGGSVEETFEAGQMSGLTFSGDNTGGPLKVQARYVGKRPTIASYTNATAQVIGTNGYYTASGATFKYEVDSGTPATETNIQSFSLNIDRPVSAVPTANSTSVSYVAIGLVDPTFQLSLLMDDYEAYRATFYGAVGGSAPSATIVYGSVELNFVHTTQALWSFKLTIPNAVLASAPAEPDPSGGPLVVNISGYAAKPGSGEHVQPIVINGTTTAA